MLEEVSAWNCYKAQGLIPPEYGLLCLRNLVRDLNSPSEGRQKAYGRLAMYAQGLSSEDDTVRCGVSSCEAEIPIDHNLKQLLEEVQGETS